MMQSINQIILYCKIAPEKNLFITEFTIVNAIERQSQPSWELAMSLKTWGNAAQRQFQEVMSDNNNNNVKKLRTFWRIEEVEERIILNCLRYGSFRTTVFVFLHLFNHSDSNVFTFLPINWAPKNNGKVKNIVNPHKIT